MTEENNSTIQKTEFNSNLAVLERTNKIIDSINSTRFFLVSPDTQNNPSILDLVNHLVALYKEIYVELTDNEKEIYTQIEELRKNTINRLKSLNRFSGEFNAPFFSNVISQADQIDLKLRELAKIHGFLSSNKENPRAAVLKT